jgi:hypothetical protein
VCPGGGAYTAGGNRGVMVEFGGFGVWLLDELVWCFGVVIDGLVEVYVEEHYVGSCLVTYGGVDAGLLRFSKWFGS